MNDGEMQTSCMTCLAVCVVSMFGWCLALLQEPHVWLQVVDKMLTRLLRVTRMPAVQQHLLVAAVTFLVYFEPFEMPQVN